MSTYANRIDAALVAAIRAVLRHNFGPTERRGVEVRLAELMSGPWHCTPNQAWDRFLKQIWKRIEAEFQRYGRERREGVRYPELEEALEGYNQIYGVVMLGGKAVVIGEELEEGIGYRPMFSKLSELRQYHARERAWDSSEGAPSLVLPFDRWGRWTRRNTFEGVVFEPTLSYCEDRREMQQGGVYNMWRGFLMEPAPGDCSVIIEHIEQVWCDGDEHKIKTVFDFLAAIVQHPEAVGLPALVLLGEQGTGKNIIVEGFFRRLLGAHMLIADKADQLLGRFNAHLAYNILTFINEAVWGGDKQKAGAYKTLFADEYRTVEPKFQGIFEVKNHTKVIMASNENWIAPMNRGDRRHVVLELSNQRRGDTEYFRRLAGSLRGVGSPAFLDVLLKRKIDFDALRKPPEWASEGRAFNILKGASNVDQFVHDLLAQGSGDLYVYQSSFYSGRTSSEWETEPTRFEKRCLHEAYLLFCGRHDFGKPHPSALFFKDLKRINGLVTGERRPRTDGNRDETALENRPRELEFAPLPEARSAFEVHMGVRIQWQELEAAADEEMGTP
jgi:hypothetical protein